MSRSGASCRHRSSRGCSRCSSTAWVVPGIIGPSVAAVVGEVAGWRWVFLGLLPLLLVAGGTSDLRAAARQGRRGAGRRRRARRAAGAPAPDPAADRRRARGGGGCRDPGGRARLPQLAFLGAGGVAGMVLLLPAYRSLTPRGTLLLALGVPAAILLRGVMTFAFFSGDAYIPLLLQTWRGTPATLTGIVFTVDHALVDRRLVAAGPAHRPLRPAAVRRPGLRVHRGRGAAHDPRGALVRAAGDHDRDLDPARPRDGVHVLRGHAGRAAWGRRRRRRGAPRRRSSCPTSWARRSAPASPARSRRRGRERAPTPLGVALALVFGMSLVAALGGLVASRRLGTVGASLPVREAAAAAVD